MVPDRLTQLLDRIESSRDELIQLTLDLLAIPTINPPGDHYRAICEFLQTRLLASGFEVKLLRATGAIGDTERFPRWNLVARHEGRNRGDCVHFNSHTDVVAVGQGWTVDPFVGQVQQGRIYGRGACDMKGGLAASIIAAEAFLALFPDYSGSVEISGTADEETGGFGGVAWLAEQGYFDPSRVQHVIIPEPLNKDRICLGHRGVWWAEIETFGHIAHGSMPFLGDCAVRHMGAVMQEFEAVLFPALHKRITEHPVVPDGARHSTMNINSIHGGLDEDVPDYTGMPSALVPDRCRMVIDRRFLVEESLEQVRAEVHRVLQGLQLTRDGFRYDVKELFSVLPSATDKSSPIVTAVADAIEAQMGRAAEYVLSPGTYDQKHIDRIGRLNNCIAYGPGILDLAHQPDEYVDIQDMLDATKVMARTLVGLLTTHNSFEVTSE